MATTTKAPMLDPDATVPQRRRWAATRPLPRMLQDVDVTLQLDGHVHELLGWRAAHRGLSLADYLRDLIDDHVGAVVERATQQVRVAGRSR
jgi:hypothetical protein